MSTFLTMDEPATLLRWAAVMLGQNGWTADAVPIGLVEEGTGRIVAVAVFNMAHDDTIWLHLATDNAKRWARHIGPVLAYGFSRAGRIVGRIAAGNVAAQILALKAGFEFEGRERMALGGRDVVVFSMLRANCSWLDEEG